MHTSVVIVGAGPGGLAMSHHLTGAGVDHVLLERGEVAHSWRTERWDSLRLLTPNWMTALPGARYEGDDPDGYMTAAETVATLEAYRRSFDPPLHTGIEVEAACHTGDGFEVRTTGGTWRCDAVVAATGGSSEPRVPAFASDLPSARPAAHLPVLPATGADRRPWPRAGGGCVSVRGADRGRAATGRP